ncbi:solute carrier organic anion transporter family member 74D-like isoform X2 [Artemia franciscana]|uniref:solute carrier organic anion transporter family member 74D-like isoform X2 n=1 Tax=Artemia franciscana TaxID=6661 RepID=UPI0032DBE232
MKNNKKAQFNEPQICEVAYDDDEDTKCGIGPFQGDWLQKFANKQSYIIVYSIIGTFQSMFFTYFVAVLTTIEKQFRFKSRTTGVVLSGNECSQILLSLLLSYFGGQGHRPRLLGIGMLCSSLACFIVIIPHLFYSPDTEIPLTRITSCLRLFGPTLGFLLAAACLKLYVNVTDQPFFGTTDPRWIGAWWLGFVAVGLLLIPAAMMISCFPRRLPRKQTRISSSGVYRQVSRQSSSKSNSPANSERPKLKDFPMAMKRLLTNKPLMWNNVNNVFTVFAISGYITFLPKYMQAQFQLSASNASIVNGIAGIAFMAMGLLIGGMVLSKLQPRAINVQIYMIVADLVYIIIFGVFAFVGCDSKPLHGMRSDNGLINPISDCNIDCSCEGLRYSPVCSEDGEMNFFSPCHAGCKENSIDSMGKKIYTDCSCLAFFNSTSNAWSNGSVTSGICDGNCMTIFYIYVLSKGILQFFAGTARVGGTIINFRCVDPKDKAVALGLGTFLLSIFAFIPGPIVYGILIDNACLLWHKDECGKPGHCWVYDPVNFRFILHSVTAGLLLVGVFADVMVCRYIKDLDLYKESDGNSSEPSAPPLAIDKLPMYDDEFENEKKLVQ